MERERFSKENLLKKAVKSVTHNTEIQLEREYNNVWDFEPDLSGVFVPFGRFRPHALARAQEKARRYQTEKAVCDFERVARIYNATKRVDMSIRNSHPEYPSSLTFTVDGDEANIVTLYDNVAFINNVAVENDDEKKLRAAFDPFRQAVMSAYQEHKALYARSTVSEIVSEKP